MVPMDTRVTGKSMHRSKNAGSTSNTMFNFSKKSNARPLTFARWGTTDKTSSGSFGLVCSTREFSTWDFNDFARFARVYRFQFRNEIRFRFSVSFQFQQFLATLVSHRLSAFRSGESEALTVQITQLVAPTVTADQTSIVVRLPDYEISKFDYY